MVIFTDLTTDDEEFTIATDKAMLNIPAEVRTRVPLLLLVDDTIMFDRSL